MRLKIGVSLLFCLFIAGCSTKTTVDKDGRIIVHRFGYFKTIQSPVYPENKNINVKGITLIGLSAGEGFTVGYKSNETIEIPLDCRVIVIVKSDSQLQHLIKELNLIGKEDLCAAVSVQE
jgi:hypothetical protein